MASSPPDAMPSASLPGCPAMFIWVVSSSRPPRFTLKWMWGAGLPGYGTGLIVRK